MTGVAAIVVAVHLQCKTVSERDHSFVAKKLSALCRNASKNWPPI
jgi:SpoVK/Ycf46/Vps4 family AAA+-type ATPase